MGDGAGDEAEDRVAAVGLPDERPLAVVDIDGVVADVRHRLHHLERRPKDWTRFFAAASRDAPHAEGLAMVAELAVDHDIVFLTGRPEHLRSVTEAWLERHGLGGHGLVMRPAGDRRPAAALKVEVVRGLSSLAPVGLVVDDDPEVLAAVRRAGFATRAARWESRSSAGERALRDAQDRDGRT